MIRTMRSFVSRVRERRWRYGQDIGALNVVCLTAGALLLGTAIYKLVMPRVSASVAYVQNSVRPYTAAGKQETCLQNIRQLSVAVSMYVQEYEGYPPLSYQTADKHLTTWVSIVNYGNARAKPSAFQCPLKGMSTDEERTVSSFGLNRAIAGTHADERDESNPDLVLPHTIILAERGDADKLAVIPPSESVARKLSPLCNVDLRHGGRANVCFDDGHVASLSSGDWLKNDSQWTSPRATLAAAKSLVAHDALLTRLSAALANEDAARTVVSANKDQLRPGFARLVSLWKANGRQPSDMWLEGLGWQAAQYYREVGHPEYLEDLNAEQSRRSQDMLSNCENARWLDHTSPDGYVVQIPEHWSATRTQKGRYAKTELRSGSPYIVITIEKGSGSKPPSSGILKWDDGDVTLRQLFGKRYRLSRMESTSFMGSPASAWVFDLERKNEPLIHKRMIGGRRYWDTYSMLFAAPARNFGKWQKVFDRVEKSFRFQ